MITATGFEKRLRKLRVWTRFQKNKPNSFASINKIIVKCNLPREYGVVMIGVFEWDKTPCGSGYWLNISANIDGVEL